MSVWPSMCPHFQLKFLSPWSIWGRPLAHLVARWAAEWRVERSILLWGNVSSQIHLISPGCPRPNSALIVHKSGLKHRSSIHPDQSLQYLASLMSNRRWLPYRIGRLKKQLNWALESRSPFGRVWHFPLVLLNVPGNYAIVSFTRISLLRPGVFKQPKSKLNHITI